MSRRTDKVLLALQIATILWAGVTLIHFTIWALVCIIGGGLDSPWWLWIAGPSGAVIGALWWWLPRFLDQ
jgi:hypothetical protein